MKQTKRIVLGLFLIAIGILLSLQLCGVISLDRFFTGWWTLFIIVPSLVGLFTDRNKVGPSIGLLLGVGLFLSTNEIISFDLFLKLFACGVIILFGLGQIVSGFSGKGRRVSRAGRRRPEPQGEVLEYCATFSSLRPEMEGKTVYGAELTAVFGRVTLDLRNAELPADATIRISAIFGSVSVLLPENVNVTVSVTPIFGGVSDASVRHREARDEQRTVAVDGYVIFGGGSVE